MKAELQIDFSTDGGEIFSIDGTQEFHLSMPPGAFALNDRGYVVIDPNNAQGLGIKILFMGEIGEFEIFPSLVDGEILALPGNNYWVNTSLSIAYALGVETTLFP